MQTLSSRSVPSFIATSDISPVHVAGMTAMVESIRNGTSGPVAVCRDFLYDKKKHLLRIE